MCNVVHIEEGKIDVILYELHNLQKGTWGFILSKGFLCGTIINSVKPARTSHSICAERETYVSYLINQGSSFPDYDNGDIFVSDDEGEYNSTEEETSEESDSSEEEDSEEADPWEELIYEAAAELRTDYQERVESFKNDRV